MARTGRSLKKILDKFQQGMNFNQFQHLCDKFERTGKHLKNNDVLWKEVNPPQKVLVGLATDATNLASAAITLNPQGIAEASIDTVGDILDVGKWVVSAGHAVKVKYKKHKQKHKHNKEKAKKIESEGSGSDEDSPLHKDAELHQDIDNLGS